MKNRIQRTLLAAAACGLLAGALGAQATEPTERMLATARSNYTPEFWKTGQMRDGFPLASLELAGFRGGALRSDHGHMSRSFFPADAPADAPPAFLVEALVADSVPEAQDALLLWLAGLSSADLAPRDSDRDLSFGEVGFVGPSGAGAKAFSWIAFVRGNVAVRVVSFDPRATPDLDLAAPTKAIDTGISARAPLALGAPVPKPEIAKLTVEKKAVVAGEAVKLDFTVVDPAGGQPHLAWDVGGSGQGYVEERDEGWFLFTTGPGAIELSLEVTGSTGTYAEKAVELSVADD